MDIMGFAMDNMGQFTLYDLPNALFMVLVAALLGYLLARWGGRETAQKARQLALWAGLSAVGVALVRAQLPLAVALVALVLLVRPQAPSAPDRLSVLAAVLIGLGCGSGATVVTVVLFLPVLGLFRWASAAGAKH